MLHSHSFQALTPFLIAIVVLVSGFTPGLDPQTVRAQPAGSLANFEFASISDGQGWLMQGDRLFWHGNDGSEWIEITPDGLPAETRLVSIFFRDVDRGWLVARQVNDGLTSFSLYQTIDSGSHWTQVSPDLLPGAGQESLTNSVTMQWLDPSTGWLLFKHATGVNFSRGTLLRTLDGGTSWERFDPPMGEPFVFTDSSLGWMAGGPDGSHLYRTLDGGRSWEDLAPALRGSVESSLFFYLPQAIPSGDLMIPVLKQESGSPGEVLLFTSSSPGETWTLIRQIPLGSEVDYQIPPYLKLFAPQDFLLLLPPEAGGSRLARSGADPFIPQAPDEADGALVEISVAGQREAWARFESVSCSDAPGGDPTCLTRVSLASTHDGGLSWTRMPFPTGDAELVQESRHSLADLSASSGGSGVVGFINTVTTTGQGFDKCEIPSESQMLAWRSSPYKTVNLYIGGAVRGCSNKALTSAYVTRLFRMGWTFIPTWVGPQSSCTAYTYDSEISTDLTTAYKQGVAEAKSAVSALGNLGLTSPDKSGSVVYYDLEHFSGTSTCYNAVKEFMRGWTVQLHASRNAAGVYGTTCGSIKNLFSSNPNPPDVIWPAAWYGDYEYNPNASVWDLPCLSNSLYANRQRIRQYDGDHYETHGGVQLLIDSNVIDGLLAAPLGSLTQKLYLPGIQQ